MAKQKTPTPQEIYKARKEREEQERNALLPPGLINHGNTCFMNSVLQGLIATQYLSDLVRFHPLPQTVQASAPTPISSRRSPELTNGHGFGGQYEQRWTAGLPIADRFLLVMTKAWDIQAGRQRDSMSPKDILASLGEKYDQYLDFRQQDAHEFLYQLLDAMRMEEVDIIKKRQPPPEKFKKGRPTLNKSLPPPPRPRDARSTASPLPQVVNGQAEPIPEEDKLISFVDMLFGGKLASVLVCQACKHVSHSYEDFSDLSLSIKAEDYVRGRKRDKLKQFAKKLKDISETALGVGSSVRRSSSVPATPRRSTTFDDDGVIIDAPRRRSIDLVEVDPESTISETKPIETPPDATVTDTSLVIPAQEPNGPSLNPVESKERVGDHVGFVEQPKTEKKEKKDKDEDSWAKLGRRLSVTVGLTKHSKDYRRRSREEKKKTPLLLPTPEDENTISNSVTVVQSVFPSTGAVNVISEKEQLPSLTAVNEKLQAQNGLTTRPISPASRPGGGSSAASSTLKFPLIIRSSSPAPSNKRSKPRPPKPTSEESAYLRQILADINTVPINPFAIFKPPKDLGCGTPASHPNAWLKMSQLPGIEECLRMFTSVEVLDGENMVGCHRCWKIANGVYKPKSRHEQPGSESCTDSEDEKRDVEYAHDQDQRTPRPDGVTPQSFRATGVESSSPTSPSPSITGSLSSSVTSLQDSSPHDTEYTLSSEKTANTTISSNSHKPASLNIQSDNLSSNVHPTTYGGLTIPSISTTGPESPLSAPATARPFPERMDTMASTSTQDSLSAPKITHRRPREPHGDSATESTDDLLSDAESDGSENMSLQSAASSVHSPIISPLASQENVVELILPSTEKQHALQTSSHSAVPRSKQVIMGPAFKRYLIATPPPVLVVHLKRFHQTSKAPVLSFSSGFKKLDDYVSFPEYLNMAPYLAPRRDDFFKSKSKSTAKSRGRQSERCMYRLYAIVVHIGNMLGGHYVAYTALPSHEPEQSSPDAASESEKQTSTTKTQRDWAYISDTVVRLATLEEVLKSKAYICMYQRI